MKTARYATPLLLLLIWQGLCYYDIIPRYIFPSPLDIVLGFKDLVLIGLPPGYPLHKHILYSLYRVACGYCIAVFIAIPLGLVMGWSSTVRALLNPPIEMLRPIPPLAWIPISILWFGIGVKSAAFIIFLGVFFPILLNTVSGVRSINPLYVAAARTLNASDRDIFLKVLIPGAIPSIFVGMRIGLGIGWMTLVAAEFTGVKSGYGLGYMIMTARDIQRPDEIVAGMVIIGLVGLSMNTLCKYGESRIVKWKEPR